MVNEFQGGVYADIHGKKAEDLSHTKSMGILIYQQNIIMTSEKQQIVLNPNFLSKPKVMVII